MRVLLVEDSGPTRDLVAATLEDAGIEVTTAARYATGLKQALIDGIDVILLDLMLPDGDGLDMCRELRALGCTTPILCVTARGDVADRVRGLDAGADDYLRKPFALAELQARVRALARRRNHAAPAHLVDGEIALDFAVRRCRVRGAEVALTMREWQVLALLAAQAGRIVQRSEILDTIWHDVSKASSNSLDVIIGRLRRKLVGGRDAEPIRTIRGEGYVFNLAS